MKYLTILFALVILATSSCHKTDIEKGTPRCVEFKIRDFDKGYSCSDANVDEYFYQGNTTYVFYPGSCGADMQSEVINSDCKTLGFLGGFTGNTNINGEEFSNAIYIRTIWEK